MKPQEKRYQDELQRQAHMSIEELLSSKEGRYERARRIAQTIIVLTIISGGMGWVLLYLLPEVPDVQEIVNKPLAALTLQDIAGFLGWWCAAGMWLW